MVCLFIKELRELRELRKDAKEMGQALFVAFSVDFEKKRSWKNRKVKILN